MTDPVDLALDGFKTVISSLAPTGFDPLRAAYIYPREAEAWRQQFDVEDLPIGIIDQVVGEANTWQSLAAGQVLHKWHIGFRLLLRRGALNDSEQAHEVAQLQNAYVRETIKLLAGSSTLNGTIALLGEGRRGKIADSSIGHLSWLKADYWGVYFLVPVQQVLSTNTRA